MKPPPILIQDTDRDAVETNTFIKILADKGYIDNELKASLLKGKDVLLLSIKNKTLIRGLVLALESAMDKKGK